ncbi:MIP/aquaporin family protein [Urechidicola croceus]|uniref:Aquaporin n=1 Tax=Urechidicola croceus TaxID=1850246 RepID=A0A1D8P932_9FLAO|nr:MIP/aquaporin family protein [Urechidicola croceus]AOW21072.1 aquaporin [Urechidicola croceus]
MSIYVAEFLGTFLLILLGGGVVASVLLKNSKAENSGWNTIVITWGIAVTFAIYAVGKISGAHINPAVTLGLAFAGDFPWEKVLGFIIAQISGAFAGATLVWIFYIPHWSATEDKLKKLSVFSTVPAMRSYIHNFVSEMIASSVLIFGIFFIGINEFTEGLNPIVVGGLVVLIGYGLGATTGYAINPARDFGPRLAHYIMPINGKGDSDWSYAFIPILAPILGGFLGASLYKILYEQEYLLKYWIVIIVAVLILTTAVYKSFNLEKK